MNKKILTIDDLVKFCETNKFHRFSSTETGYQLAVKVPTTFEIDQNVDDNHRGMTKLKFRIFHSGLNRNGSYVSEDAANKAMKTIPDRPVLAAIHQLDDGSYDFEGHEMEIVTNDKGEEELVYIEHQVGSFSSEPAFWEHDDELDKDYVCAYAYVANEYTKTIDIINSKGGTKNSCELCIEELAFNGKEKYLDLIDFYVSGSTLLGSRDDGTQIGEGMLGSRADIADFSTQNNSIMQYADKLDSLTSKVDLLLSRFDIDNSEEGGNQSNMEKFNELLAKYNKTVEDIDFDYESMTDEELEAKFAELFSDGDEENEDTPSEDEENEIAPLAEEDEDPVEEEEEIAVDTNDEIRKKFTKEEAFNAVFEISFDEIHYALNTLCSVYRNENEWCYVSQVYDDYFIMMDWDSDKYYKQSYVREGDNVALSGERIEMFAMLLTESEKIAVDEMRSNYAALVDYKENVEKNELHVKREEILANEKYASISDNEDFKKLVENMDNYSLDELEREAKIIFADNIDVAKFSATETKKSEVKLFGNVNKTKKESRYGTLFSK